MSPRRLTETERSTIIDAVASAIRHDARNKLGTIRNAAYYIRRKVGDTDPYKTDPRVPGFFELIEEALDSIDHLLLERMGHKLSPLPGGQPVRLGNAVVTSLQMALPTSHLKLTLRLEDQIEVAAPIDELTLLARYLIDNAVEAMPNGGSLTIRTYDTENQVALSVEDSGPGFTEESAHHAFDPFYTTKPNHIGLGLCLSRRTALRYEGTLTIDRLPQGARVTVSFRKGNGEAADEL